MASFTRCVASLAFAALAACSGDPAAPEVAVVGALDGSDGMVAVVRHGDRVVAYTCGGPTSVTLSTGWFETTLTPGQSTFTAERMDGLVLSGAFTNDGAAGTLKRADGTTATWTAHSGTGPSGLWAGPASPCRTGAIVMTGASGEPTAVGAWCDGAGTIRQVVPVHPIVESASGLAIRLDVDPPSAPVIWLTRFDLP